jgi:hypothetical protein
MIHGILLFRADSGTLLWGQAYTPGFGVSADIASAKDDAMDAIAVASFLYALQCQALETLPDSQPSPELPLSTISFDTLHISFCRAATQAVTCAVLVDQASLFSDSICTLVPDAFCSAFPDAHTCLNKKQVKLWMISLRNVFAQSLSAFAKSVMEPSDSNAADGSSCSCSWWVLWNSRDFLRKLKKPGADLERLREAAKRESNSVAVDSNANGSGKNSASFESVAPDASGRAAAPANLSVLTGKSHGRVYQKAFLQSSVFRSSQAKSKKGAAAAAPSILDECLFAVWISSSQRAVWVSSFVELVYAASQCMLVAGVLDDDLASMSFRMGESQVTIVFRGDCGIAFRSAQSSSAASEALDGNSRRSSSYLTSSMQSLVETLQFCASQGVTTS